MIASAFDDAFKRAPQRQGCHKKSAMAFVLWNASRIHKSFYMSKNASKAVPKSVSQMTKLCKNFVCLCVSSGASNIQIIHTNKQILIIEYQFRIWYKGPTSILSFSISTCTYSYQYLPFCFTHHKTQAKIFYKFRVATHIVAMSVFFFCP